MNPDKTTDIVILSHAKDPRVRTDVRRPLGFGARLGMAEAMYRFVFHP
jgi:hypothetical protein